MAGKRVGIIGAGCSGLVAIKSCLEEGLVPVCYERTHEIGGLWRYTDEVNDGQACVQRSTVVNTSKEMMSFSDFPIPAHLPNFVHNTQVQDYFHTYADQFNLRKHINFNTEILNLNKAKDFAQTGRWDIKLRDAQGNDVTETFDYVMVCTGHHAEKNVAHFPGEKDFAGEILHSHDYRHSEGYEGKNVIVVGIGNSGIDVAAEVGLVTKQTYLSTRRGAWVATRVWEHGIPFDMQQLTRFRTWLIETLPWSWTNWFRERKCQRRFNHEDYGIMPTHRYNQQHPTVNDDLPIRISYGDIIVKPNIRKITKTGVEFDDGSRADDVHSIILATGYDFGFPFVDPSVLKSNDNKIDLFKYVFPPDLEKNTLAVVGFIQPVGSVMPLSELQSRWAALVFRGALKLPSREEMWNDIKKKSDDMAKRYVETRRHTIQVDWVQFMDDTALQFGCKPDLWRMWLRDPKLARQCLMGPCVPYQYRLTGPGKWAGARDAILNIGERIRPIAWGGRKVKGLNSGGSVGVKAALAIAAVSFVGYTVYGNSSKKSTAAAPET